MLAGSACWTARPASSPWALALLLAAISRSALSWMNPVVCTTSGPWASRSGSHVSLASRLQRQRRPPSSKTHRGQRLPRLKHPAPSRNWGRIRIRVMVRIRVRVRLANHGQYRTPTRQQRRARPVPRQLCKPLRAHQQPAKHERLRPQRGQVHHQPSGQPPANKQPPDPQRPRQALQRRQAKQPQPRRPRSQMSEQ